MKKLRIFATSMSHPPRSRAPPKAKDPRYPVIAKDVRLWRMDKGQEWRLCSITSTSLEMKFFDSHITITNLLKGWLEHDRPQFRSNLLDWGQC
jgi:hypothetical protein